MNRELLEEVLTCPSLPSLPSVAVRVIDLTADPDVSIETLAKVIQNDQGLATRVLRTVNSSFYGLRRPCTTIRKALILLGLGPVKNLALGFSLVCALNKSDEDFDHATYWQRQLDSAVAARIIAQTVGLTEISDEVFLAGLIEDIGVLAMHRALGDRYAAVFDAAGHSHRDLLAKEIDTFGLSHAQVGAMLAERWRFPEALTMPVRHHEDPADAPQSLAGHCRCVALGNLIHEALCERELGPAQELAASRAHAWFGIVSPAYDEVLEDIRQKADEVATLLSLKKASNADRWAIADRASRRLEEISSTGEAPAFRLDDEAQRDPVTGLPCRARFDAAAADLFDEAHNSGRPMLVAQLLVQPASGSDELSDPMAIAVANQLDEWFGAAGATICRLGPNSFGVLLVDVEPEKAETLAKVMATDLTQLARNWPGDASSGLTISTGIAATLPDSATSPSTAGELIAASTRALAAAKASGGGCRVFPARHAA